MHAGTFTFRSLASHLEHTILRIHLAFSTSPALKAICHVKTRPSCLSGLRRARSTLHQAVAVLYQCTGCISVMYRNQPRQTSSLSQLRQHACTSLQPGLISNQAHRCISLRMRIPSSAGNTFASWTSGECMFSRRTHRCCQPSSDFQGRSVGKKRHIFILFSTLSRLIRALAIFAVSIHGVCPVKLKRKGRLSAYKT